MTELSATILIQGSLLVAQFIAILAISPRVRYMVFPRFVSFKKYPYRIARIVTRSKKNDGVYYRIEFPGSDREYGFSARKLDPRKFSRAEWKALQNESHVEEVLDA